MSTIVGTLNPRQPVSIDCKGEPSFEYRPEGWIRIKSPPISDDEEVDTSYALANNWLVARDYQNCTDNDSFIRIESCRSLSTEIQDATLKHEESDGMINNDSKMHPIKEEPDANAVSTMVMPVENSENETIQDTKIPVKDVKMKVMKREELPPMQTRSRTRCREVKKDVVPTQKWQTLPVKRRKPLKKRTKPPIVTRTRRILPKLMPILTAIEGGGTDVEEQALETEDPLKEVKLVSGNLNAMDKMLDDLRNTCPVCSMRFNTALEMGRHFRQRHENQFRCRNCHFRCSTSEDLTEHLRTHDQDTYLQCDLCSRKYKRMEGLVAHWVQKHSTVDPKSIRETHSKQSNPAFNTKDPKNTWDLRKLLSRTYSCQTCKNEYSRKSFLIAHERIAHGVGTDTQPYQCAICNKTFKNRHQLYHHKKSHNQAQKPPTSFTFTARNWNGQNEC